MADRQGSPATASGAARTAAVGEIGLPRGRHVIADVFDAPFAALDDARTVERAIRDAVAAGGARLLDVFVHRFSPYGVTATATLAESHVAVHTWPEHGYAAIDAFFCGAADPVATVEHLARGLGATRVDRREVPRGAERATSVRLADGVRIDVRVLDRVLDLGPSGGRPEVAMVEHAGLGRLLVVEGEVRAAERDHAATSEMLAHVPLVASPRAGQPCDVLVVGGADGLVVREVLRHPWVRRVIVRDSAREVATLCRRHRFGGPDPFADPRVAWGDDWGDDAREGRGAFDVVLVTAPLANAAPPSVTRWIDRLADDGVLAVGLGSFDARAARSAVALARAFDLRGGAAAVYRGSGTVVTPDEAFVLGGRAGLRLAEPKLAFEGEVIAADVHAAAFVLPPRWRRALREALVSDPPAKRPLGRTPS